MKKKIKDRVKAEVKYDEDEGVGAGAILAIGLAGLGLWAWLRSRKAQAILATKQFRQRSVKPNRPGKPQGKQMMQQWLPESYHWRGG